MLNEQDPERPIRERIKLLASCLAAAIQKSPDIMVWIGSGLSMGPGGYPDWDTTIARLCAVCLPEKFDVPPSLMESREKLIWADECRAANESKYFSTLADLFGEPHQFIRTAYTHICACPFRYLVTTNFDPCLELAGGSQREVISYPNLSLVNQYNRNTVVYLHGKARHNGQIDTTNLVLTGRDFTFAYNPSTALLYGFLQQLLFRHSVIFVGCRLEEPSLTNVFDSVASIHRQTPSANLQRTILLCDDSPETERKENARFEKLGIDVLRYPRNKDPDPHKYLDDLWELVRIMISNATPPSFIYGRTI